MGAIEDLNVYNEGIEQQLEQKNEVIKKLMQDLDTYEEKIKKLELECKKTPGPGFRFPTKYK